jgi:transcriptional regulator with XRE-family HTH domain
LRRSPHANGLLQEAIANAADINRAYMSKLETSATHVGLEITGKLADVLEVEEREFLKPVPRRKRSR